MGKYKLYGGNADWDFIRKLASDKLGAEFEWVKRSRAAEQAKRMSDVEAVEVIAEALAKHHAVGMGICNCGWSTETKLGHSWREKHEAHQASVIAALPNIAIVALPADPGDGNYWRWTDWNKETEEAFHEALLGELRRIHAVSVATTREARAAASAGGES